MSIVSVNPPASDFLSGLLGARVAGGEPLTLVEAMLANPDQLDAVRENPDLVATMVEEILRFESPAQGPWRTCSSAG